MFPRSLSRSTLAALLVLLPCGVAAQGQGPAMVYLADGTSLPMRSWSLSYEFQAWRQGTGQALASPRRVDLKDLLIGKRRFAAASSTLEIRYAEVEREREQEGQVVKVRVPLAKEMTLTGSDGKKTVLKPEPPPRETLLPGADKAILVMARSLDLRGETLTGTKRTFCLLSYTSLVECVDDPGQQVVKVEFQR